MQGCTDVHRLDVLAGPLAACATVVGPYLVMAALARSLVHCSLEGCPDSGLEGWDVLGWLGAAILVAGVGLAARWSGRRRPLIRWPLSGVASTGTGLLLLGLGLPTVAAWGENVALFGMVAAAMAVAVPSRSAWWGIGLAAAAGIASTFGDDPMPGLLVAALTLGAVSSAEALPAGR